jgi:hypothetical protein
MCCRHQYLRYALSSNRCIACPRLIRSVCACLCVVSNGQSFALIANTGSTISRFALTASPSIPLYTETRIASAVGGYVRVPFCSLLSLLVHAVCAAMLCCAVLCCAVLCCAVLCCAVLCCAVLYRCVVTRRRSDTARS